jgi:hypothetical protein
MGRTACTEPQCLYEGDLYFILLLLLLLLLVVVVVVVVVVLWVTAVYNLTNKTQLSFPPICLKLTIQHVLSTAAFRCIIYITGCRLGRFGLSYRRRSSLRHCATSRKVAGSIHEGNIKIFHWYNTTGRNVTLGLTQTLMSTKCIPCGVKAAGA